MRAVRRWGDTRERYGPDAGRSFGIRSESGRRLLAVPDEGRPTSGSQGDGGLRLLSFVTL